MEEPRRRGARRKQHLLVSPRERRSCTRYALNLTLLYATYHQRKLIARGTGVAANMSSSGLCFRADHPLRRGLKINITISWPWPSDQGLQLELLARGKIIWSSGLETGVEIQHHEFRMQRP